MLIAKTELGERVDARVAEKGNKYYCQLCGELLILKQGEVMIYHFAHYPGADCHLWESESDVHIKMKINMQEKLQGSNDVNIIELEYPVYDDIGMLVPDVYVELESEDKIAVECQASNKSIEDILIKTIRYTNLGIYTLWVFQWNEVLGFNNRRIKLPSMERGVYNITNQLFVIDNDDLGVLKLKQEGNLKTMFYSDGIKLDRYILDLKNITPDIINVTHVRKEWSNIELKGDEQHLNIEKDMKYLVRLKELLIDESYVTLVLSNPRNDNDIYIIRGNVGGQNTDLANFIVGLFSDSSKEGTYILKRKLRNTTGYIYKVDDVLAWASTSEREEYERLKKTFIAHDSVIKGDNYNAWCNLKVSSLINNRRKTLNNIQKHFCRDVKDAYKKGELLEDIADSHNVSRKEVLDCIAIQEKKVKQGLTVQTMDGTETLVGE